MKNIDDAEGGFVNQGFIAFYLQYYETPEDVEFYICGQLLIALADEKRTDNF